MPVDDRRGAPRLPGNGIVLVRPEAASLEPLARSGRVMDFSKTGIALLLKCPFPPGTILSLSPIGWVRSASLSAKVIHCQEVGGQWHHGCEFVQKLNHKDLEHFFSFNLKIS